MDINPNMRNLGKSDLSEVDSFKQEVKALREQLSYARAESENLRNHLKRELEQTKKLVLTNFAKDLIHIADLMELTLGQFAQNVTGNNELLSKVLEGVRLTHIELQKTFERYSIQRIYPLGEKFDPNLHQIMFEHSSKENSGIVVSIVQPGYLLNENLLRPAMVGVSKLNCTIH